MGENIARRQRVMEPKGGYQGGLPASEVGPPAKMPTAISPAPDAESAGRGARRRRRISR